MDEPLDELYLKWLYGQVLNPKLKNSSRTYWSLLRLLYKKEFVWIIPNDDNRIEDGKDLRYEFIEDIRDWTRKQDDWLELGCSMLEMLIGLSRRLQFEDDRPAGQWFWILIRNLNLQGFSDNTKFDLEDVDEVLDTVIWRTYEPDGRGGLFPLDDPEEDQREVEIWYQLSAYLLE